jgi:hypothetical protein
MPDLDRQGPTPVHRVCVANRSGPCRLLVPNEPPGGAMSGSPIQVTGRVALLDW